VADTMRLYILAALCVLAVAMPHDHWVRVPGGSIIHKSCIVSVPAGYRVATNERTGGAVLVNDDTGDSIAVKRCKHRHAPTLQIYAIDVHFTPATDIMYTMNTSWTVPNVPPTDQGQVVYFWPGFKSTEPTMGLPVLQPVLQYGTDSEGGGRYWCVRSWFVWGNQGQAYVSPEVDLQPGDVITSYMSLDNNTDTWTVYARSTQSSQDTTLTIARAQAGACDYHVAMLVLETIMPENQCSLLPADPNAVTFSGMVVNGDKTIPWEQRVQMHDCNQAITMMARNKIKFSWTNQ